MIWCKHTLKAYWSKLIVWYVLFGEPGNFYIYLSYGINSCVNIVTGRKNWANGVLLRSIAIQGENERIASGPGLLAKRFGLNKNFDNLHLSPANDFWLTEGENLTRMGSIVQTTRIGISQAKDIRWRWYLKSSRSVSKRVRGDRIPPKNKCWSPSTFEELWIIGNIITFLIYLRFLWRITTQS